MTETYGQPAPPKPTSPFVWVGLGCGLVFFGIVGFIAFILFVVFSSMRSSTPYQEAVRRAQSDPRVIEMLGQPVNVGWFISGSIKTQNRDGYANLSIPISGPRGKATIDVSAVKRRGQWIYNEIIVTKEKEEIDLLSPPESPDTSPPAE